MKRIFILTFLALAVPGCRKEVEVPGPVLEDTPEPRELVLIRRDPHMDEPHVRTIDVTWWEEGEDAVKLGASYYPWQGEDSIHYNYSHRTGRVFVDGELVGVDLRKVKIGEIDGHKRIVTVTCQGIAPQTLEPFPDLRIAYLILSPGLDYDIKLLSKIPSDIRLYIHCINPTNAELRRISRLSNVRGLLLSQSTNSIRRMNINHKLRHLKRIQDLRFLSIKNLKLTDSGLRNIGRLKNLKELWLDVSIQTYTIYDYLDAFGLHLPFGSVESVYEMDWHLRICNRYSQSVTEAGFKHIENLKSLESLSLRYGKDINEDILACIASLPNLRDLRLYESYISNQGLEYLASHTNLTKLDCSEVNINDTGIMYVSRLPNLRYLCLDRVDITDAAIKYLLELKNLDVLRIGIWGVDISEEGLLQLEKELPVSYSRF